MTPRTSTAERLAPLTGLVFAVAFIVVFTVGGNSPDSNAKTAKVIHYWTAHKDNEMTTALVAAVALLFFAWFAGSLRAHLAVAEGGGRRLANTAFGGAIIFTVGGLLFSALSFSAADTVGKVPAAVTQSIHVLSNDLFLPLSGGAALLMLATGVLTLRTRALPAWLGWVAVVIGVVAVTPIGFVGFFGLILWVAIVSVVLYRRPLEPGAATPAV
jgi:hypothetical protein